MSFEPGTRLGSSAFARAARLRELRRDLAEAEREDAMKGVSGAFGASSLD